ncbi:unnamed protein product [Nippostrongylus brasiliensis]|uniref:Transposase n=1 Tax=Nippostrongylus brasiliensis TaxID=27835 RepID=A0A0N4XVV2_NIPBR|nr:unnamed protein product [Nippostrongylus brasiliensis]
MHEGIMSNMQGGASHVTHRKGPAFIATPLDSWREKCRPFILKNRNDNGDNDAVCMTSQTQPAGQITELLDWKRFNDIRTCVMTVGNVLRFIRNMIRRVSDKLRERLESAMPTQHGYGAIHHRSRKKTSP